MSADMLAPDVADIARSLHAIVSGAAVSGVAEAIGEGARTLAELFEDVPQSLAIIAIELVRLNDNLAAGTFSLRTHHPLCMTPTGKDYGVHQLEVIGKFVDAAIADGRLVLPPKEGAA